MSFKWLLLVCIKVIEISEVVVKELCEECQYLISRFVPLLQFKFLSSDSIQVYRFLVPSIMLASKQQLKPNSIENIIVCESNSSFVIG